MTTKIYHTISRQDKHNALSPYTKGCGHYLVDFNKPIIKGYMIKELEDFNHGEVEKKIYGDRKGSYCPHCHEYVSLTLEVQMIYNPNYIKIGEN